VIKDWRVGTIHGGACHQDRAIAQLVHARVLESHETDLKSFFVLLVARRYDVFEIDDWCISGCV
jgi:hypothetical protein